MIIFDFDGVLMDSVREMAVTAYNTLTGGIVTRPNQMPSRPLGLFLANRFHVQPAGDSLILMKWCLDNSGSEPARLLSEKEYDLLVHQAEESPTMRTSRFFDTRRQFRATDIKAWYSLHEPVQPVWRLLRERPDNKMLIMTNKNHEATTAICNHFGLEISNDRIYSGDNGRTKIDNFNRILQRFKASTYAFIDDSVKNLSEIDTHFNRNEKVVSLIFAKWGYHGPNDAQFARNHGYHIPDIKEFIDPCLF